MVFAHDQLTSGQKFRGVTAIDKWNRQCVALHVDFALTGQSVVGPLKDESCTACRRRLVSTTERS
jgi:predicted  nucleic acid-binding Zn-ribbon protein